MKKHLIPFDFMPSSWGLYGKSYRLARAEYELEGEELERALVHIMCENDDEMMAEKLLDLKLKYGHITKSEHRRQFIEMTMDVNSVERKLALLQLDYEDHAITELEYEKQQATLKDLPWVTVIKLELEEDKPDSGSMELDWNPQFIEYLKKSGYDGHYEEQIVERWLGELCRNLALEQFSGVGDFDEQVKASANDA